MPRAPGSGRDVTQTLRPCLLCGRGTRSRGADNPGEQQSVASCSVVAEGGWGLLFVTFRQGRLQRQGPGGARESGAHLPFSVSQRAPLTVTGQRGPLAALNLKGEERATRPCGWRPTGDSWWLPQSPPATPFPSSPAPSPYQQALRCSPGGRALLCHIGCCPRPSPSAWLEKKSKTFILSYGSCISINMLANIYRPQS